MKQVIRCFAITFFIHLVLISPVHSQTGFSWVKQFGGGDYDYGSQILYSADGNIYIVGHFYDSLDVDPGPGISMLFTDGVVNSYIAKYDTAGNYIWAKQLKNNTINEITKCILDSYNNIIAVGMFNDSTDFDPGSGSYILPPGEGDAGFIWKLDEDGNFMYAGKFGGHGNCQPVEIKVDNNGNMLLTGTFSDTVDFDPGEGIGLLCTPEWTYNAFICKLDTSGNFIWVKQFENNSMNATDCGYTIATDASNNIFIGGRYTGITDFDTGPGQFFLYGDYNGDGFFCKLDSSGNFVFALKIGGDGTSSIGNLIITRDSAVLFSGYFDGTCTFDSIGAVYLQSPHMVNSSFLCKMTMQGELLWVKMLKASAALGIYIDELIQDTSGNFYLAGSFDNPVDFDPGPDEFIMSSNGWWDLYICKYDSAFNIKWGNHFGSGGYEYVVSCQTDNADHVYCTGSFENTVDFDPGPGVYNLTSNGNWDGFILKLDEIITSNSSFLSFQTLKASPNPADKMFTIHFQSIVNAGRLSFTDMTGRVVSVTDIQQGQSTATINCSFWSPGVYLGQVLSKGLVIAKCKVVVK
jgi:hypothetical protein